MQFFSDYTVVVVVVVVVFDACYRDMAGRSGRSCVVCVSVFVSFCHEQNNIFCHIELFLLVCIAIPSSVEQLT